MFSNLGKLLIIIKTSSNFGTWTNAFHFSSILKPSNLIKHTYLSANVINQSRRQKNDYKKLKTNKKKRKTTTHSIFHGSTPPLHWRQPIRKSVILTIFWYLLSFWSTQIYPHFYLWQYQFPSILTYIHTWAHRLHYAIFSCGIVHFYDTRNYMNTSTHTYIKGYFIHTYIYIYEYYIYKLTWVILIHITTEKKRNPNLSEWKWSDLSLKNSEKVMTRVQFSNAFSANKLTV